jgi:hypothetical protein
MSYFPMIKEYKNFYKGIKWLTGKDFEFLTKAAANRHSREVG